MAGTDKTKAATQGGPAVILVDPQLGENIGMVARAMLNCGLGDLRLVRPRDGWPSRQAEAAASGADTVLNAARLFYTLGDAIADLDSLYAATARTRDMTKSMVTPRQAAIEVRAAEAEGRKVGLLLGPERSGLTSDDVALADAIIQVPLNPSFSSLNLAQAVLLIGYEWYQAADETPARVLSMGPNRPATKEELINFFERLEATLEDTGFLRPPERRPAMVRNLRSLFTRADLTEQEVRSLHGIISALIGKKRPKTGG